MIIIHVDVIKVLGILEDSEILSVQFNLTAIWQDPRLTYRNLKKENFKNIVSKTEGDTIWYPVVLFQGCNSIDILNGLNPSLNLSLNRLPIWHLPKRVLNLVLKVYLNPSLNF